MERTEIVSLYKNTPADGTVVTVCGWAKTVRDSKNIGFIELSDGSCFKPLQVVFEAAKLENYKDIAKALLFLCFQRPTGIFQPAGRPAIRSGSSGIPYQRCGFKWAPSTRSCSTHTAGLIPMLCAARELIPPRRRQNPRPRRRRSPAYSNCTPCPARRHRRWSRRAPHHFPP